MCLRSFKGDIAIDEIKVEGCQSPSVTPKPTVSGMFFSIKLLFFGKNF